MPPSSPGARHAVVLVLISCLPILGTLLIAPVLPAIGRHFALQSGVEYLVPLVQTAPALVLALSGTFVGNLSARLGRKRILLWSLVVYALAAPAPLVIDSLHGIILSRLLVGLAEAGLMTTATTLIGDYFSDERRARYLGMQVLASSCSAVLFMTLGGALGTMGWRAPFAAYFAAALLIPLALFMLWEPAQQTEESGTDDCGAEFPWKHLLTLVGITFFAGMCMNLMSVEIGFIVDSLGETRTDIIGIVAALNSTGIVVGSLVFGNARSLTNSRTALIVAILLTAGGYALLYAARSTPMVAMGGIVAGMGCGFYLPWLLAEVNRGLSFEHRSRGNGMWLSSYFLAVVAGPPIATVLAKAQGGLQTAMLTFAIALVVLALVVSVTLRNPAPQALRSRAA